jgi:hypothetical protein
LTHVIQQQSAPASAGLVQRKITPPKAHAYRDCTEKTTFSNKADQELDAARIFASDLVDAAIGALVKRERGIPNRSGTTLHRSDLRRAEGNLQEHLTHARTIPRPV